MRSFEVAFDCGVFSIVPSHLCFRLHRQFPRTQRQNLIIEYLSAQNIVGIFHLYVASLSIFLLYGFPMMLHRHYSASTVTRTQIPLLYVYDLLLYEHQVLSLRVRRIKNAVSYLSPGFLLQFQRTPQLLLSHVLKFFLTHLFTIYAATSTK